MLAPPLAGAAAAPTLRREKALRSISRSERKKHSIVEGGRGSMCDALIGLPDRCPCAAPPYSTSRSRPVLRRQQLPLPPPCLHTKDPISARSSPNPTASLRIARTQARILEEGDGGSEVRQIRGFLFSGGSRRRSGRRGRWRSITRRWNTRLAVSDAGELQVDSGDGGLWSVLFIDAAGRRTSTAPGSRSPPPAFAVGFRFSRAVTDA
jgi:hypothetical protein